jgi:hypothetical protein
MTAHSTAPADHQALQAAQPDTALDARDVPAADPARCCSRSLATLTEILQQLGMAVRVLADGATHVAETASTQALWVEGAARTARDMVVDAQAAVAIAAQSHAEASTGAPCEAAADGRQQRAALSGADAALLETAKSIEQIGHQLDLMALQCSMEAARAEGGPPMWSAIAAQIEQLTRTVSTFDLPPDLHS